jgi:hypothetical protein
MASQYQLQQLTAQWEQAKLAHAPGSEERNSQLEQISTELQALLLPAVEAYKAANPENAPAGQPTIPDLTTLEGAVERKIADSQPASIQDPLQKTIKKQTLEKSITLLQTYKANLNTEAYQKLDADIDTKIEYIEDELRTLTTTLTALNLSEEDQTTIQEHIQEPSTVDDTITTLAQDIEDMADAQTRACLMTCDFFKQRYQEYCTASTALEGNTQQKERCLNVNLPLLAWQETPQNITHEAERNRRFTVLVQAIKDIPELNLTTDLPEVANGTALLEQVPYGLHELKSCINELKELLTKINEQRNERNDPLTTNEKYKQLERETKTTYHHILEKAEEYCDLVSEHACGAMSAVRPETAKAIIMGVNNIFDAYPVNIKKQSTYFYDKSGKYRTPPLPHINQRLWGSNLFQVEYKPNYLQENVGLESTVNFKLGKRTPPEIARKASMLQKDMRVPYLAPNSSNPETAKLSIHHMLMKHPAFGPDWIKKHVRYDKDTGKAIIKWKNNEEASQLLNALQTLNEEYIKYKAEHAKTPTPSHAGTGTGIDTGTDTGTGTGIDTGTDTDTDIDIDEDSQSARVDESESDNSFMNP